MKVLHVVPWEPPSDFVLKDMQYLRSIGGIETGILTVGAMGQSWVGEELISLMRMVKRSRRIDEFRPDVVHCHFLVSLIGTLFCHYPVVVTTHDSCDVYGRLSRALIKRMAVGAILIHVSDYNRRYWAPRLGKSGDVVYHAIDTSFYNPHRRNERIRSRVCEFLGSEKWVMTMGPLEYSRGHHAVLDALSRLARRGEAPGLVVKGYGGGERYARFLCERAQELNVPLLLIRQKMPDSVLASLLASSDAFIRPTTRESFGIAVLEAQACGVPTLVNNCCSLSEVFGSSSMLFNIENTFDLAEKIGLIVNNDSVRTELIGSGLENAAKLTWDRKIESYARIYNKALTQDRRTSR